MCKKLGSLALALLALIFITSPARADSFAVGDFIAYTDSNPPAPGVNGIGERWISKPPPSVNLVTPTPTFCVSLSDFAASTMYIGNISTVAGGSFALTPDVAFLYTEFRNGTLSGYDYSLPNRNADAEALQYAIWILMGETTMPHVPAGIQSDVQAYIDLADAANWQDIGNVRVLNLYRQAGFGQEPYDPAVYDTRAQDLLTIVPEPGSLLLLGSGLALLAGLARYKRS
jgi:hypothetical protein